MTRRHSMLRVDPIDRREIGRRQRAATRAYDGHVDTEVQAFVCEANCADCGERFRVVKAGETRCQDCASEYRDSVPVAAPDFETEPTKMIDMNELPSAVNPRSR